MAKYTITIEDLGTINRVYYTLDGEDTEISPYDQEGNTITCEVELPEGASLPQVDYVSSEVESPALSLDTIGAVDIKSVTDENGNMLNYTVNENGTINVGDTVAAGTAISINYDLERIKIGALDFENGDKTKPTKYGMRIRNSQGEDVFTTADDGNITMTGTVNARAGEFSGNVLVGDSEGKYITMSTEIEDEPVIASSDYVENNNQGWRINGSGDAVFNNITARGSLKTATFEYEEIEAVGGAFLFRPSSTIRNARIDETETTITSISTVAEPSDDLMIAYQWEIPFDFPCVLTISSLENSDTIDVNLTATTNITTTLGERNIKILVNLKDGVYKVSAGYYYLVEGVIDPNVTFSIDPDFSSSIDLSYLGEVANVSSVTFNGSEDEVEYYFNKDNKELTVTSQLPSTIASYTITYSIANLIVEVEKPQFKAGDWVKLDNYKNPEAFKGEEVKTVASGLAAIYEVDQVTYEDEDEEGQTIEVIENPNELILIGGAEYYYNNYTDLIGGALISLGQAVDPDEPDKELDNYGIGINSGDGDILLPPRAISLFESTIDPEANPKVSFDYTGILGTLPTANNASLDVNSDIYLNMAGTQGIYTDNMYIGDAKQYVAFYTVKDSDPVQKKLDIAAGSISVGMGDYDPLYIIGDNTGVALYKGEKVSAPSEISSNNLFITDTGIRIREGQNPLAIFEGSQESSEIIRPYSLLSNEGQQFYLNGDVLYDFAFESVAGDEYESSYDGKEHRLIYTQEPPYSGNLVLNLEESSEIPGLTSVKLEVLCNFKNIEFNEYYNFESGTINPLALENELINGQINYDCSQYGDWSFSFDNNTKEVTINLQGAQSKIRSLQTKDDFTVTAGASVTRTVVDFDGVIRLGFILYNMDTQQIDRCITNFDFGYAQTYTPRSDFSVDYDGDKTFTFNSLINTWYGTGYNYKVQNLGFFAYFDRIFFNELNVSYKRSYQLPSLKIGYYVDDEKDYAFVLGKGTDINNKETAFGVDWDGHLYLYDDIIFPNHENAKLYAYGYNGMAQLGLGTYKDSLSAHRTGNINFTFSDTETYTLKMGADDNTLSMVKNTWDSSTEKPDWGSATEIWSVDMTKVAGLFNKTSTYVTWSNVSAGSQASVTKTIKTFTLPSESTWLIIAEGGNAKGGEVYNSLDIQCVGASDMVTAGYSGRSKAGGANPATAIRYVRTGSSTCTVNIQTYIFDTSVTNFNGTAIAIPTV